MDGDATVPLTEPSEQRLALHLTGRIDRSDAGSRKGETFRVQGVVDRVQPMGVQQSNTDDCQADSLNHGPYDLARAAAKDVQDRPRHDGQAGPFRNRSGAQ